MSTIGGMGAAALNLASSVVASSRPEAVGEQAQTQAVHQQAQTELTEAPGEVEDAQFSPDRDADGRQLYRRQPAAEHSEIPRELAEATPAETVAPSHAADAFGDRGNALDIDA